MRFYKMATFQDIVAVVMDSPDWFSVFCCALFGSIVLLWSSVAYIISDCNYNGVVDCKTD